MISDNKTYKATNNEMCQRFFVIMLFIFGCGINVLAQSESQLRKYYKDNFSSLDPIEGIYDVEQLAIPRNHIRIYNADVLKDNYQVYIYKKDNVFIQYEPDAGITGKFSKIGDTNAYTYIHSIKGHKLSDRIILQDNSIIELKYNHPTSDKEYAKIFLKKGNYIVYEETYIKTYPTASMYNEIENNKEKILSTPNQWSGTGFSLYDNFIVTNYHVVENASTILVQGFNNNFNIKLRAEVVATDKYNDLAIIKVTGTNLPNTNIPYAIKTNTSDVGEEIFVLGYPLTSTMGDEIKLTTGVISSKTGFQGDVSIYQISAPIQPGNSGGPLFDSKGNVIGIVSAKHQGAENVGYAIKTSYLRNLMESAISSDILPSNNKITGLSLSEKVKLVRNYIYYITCTK